MSNKGLVPQPDQQALGHQIIDKLTRGRLPRMVDWFDPVLLARIGVRTVISGTMGQYADQRAMQAASDQLEASTAKDRERNLATRYDYSVADPTDPAYDPARTIPRDPDHPDAVWVDYVADLGDGFEATYTMAYLMAADALKVEGCDETLKAGQILVMGGDQCYPQSTTQEYQDRLVDPYDWAFWTDSPKRRLFALPGNHDWYDGLNSFDSLFCGARHRLSAGVGRQLGGWRCQQHRSYFAVRLPHDWWIWGTDIQLEGSFDDAQLDYFDIISEQTGPGHKIIICLAEPSWLHTEYQNLHDISMLAQKHGARVAAVMAGDMHHYARYKVEELGVELITCGGGGAFAHATHTLKDKLSIAWAVPTGAKHRQSGAADPIAFNREERRIVKEGDNIDFALKPVSAEVAADGADAAAKARGQKTPYVEKPYQCSAPAIYPSRLRSRMLCLKNLALPIRNFRFALAVGVIYLIYAWVFHLAAGSPINMLRKSLYTDVRQICIANVVGQHAGHIEKCNELGRADVKKIIDNTVVHSKNIRANIEKIPGMQLKQFPEESYSPSGAVSWALGEFAGNRQEMVTWIWGIVSDLISPKRVLNAMQDNPTFFFLVSALWVGLVYYVDTKLKSKWLNLPIKFVVGSLHFFAHMTVLLSVATLLQFGVLDIWAGPEASFYSTAFAMAGYSALVILLGGLLGAAVFGLYWVINSVFFNMHCSDSFSALGIRHYKHFLRMRFEKDKLTIFPIGIDRVPGRNGWRVPGLGDVPLSHNPQIVPKSPLRPFLIEQRPIVIDAVRAHSAGPKPT